MSVLPVDTISAAEWDAALEVRRVRGTVAATPAAFALLAVCGDPVRAEDVMHTVDDAHRCLARAQHPAGTDLTRLGNLCSGKSPHDAGPWGSEGRHMQPDLRVTKGSAYWHGAQHRTSPSGGPDRLDARQQKAGRVMFAAATTCAAIIVLLVARGGW